MKLADRVLETSTTTGTGTLTLDGAVTGFQAFAVMGANAVTLYSIEDGVDWETGLGTVLTGPNRLTRDAVLASSNSGSAVNWGAGTRNVRCSLPADFGRPRFGTKSVAGTGTLALTQNEQRVDVLNLTGALTGARTIEVDATPWVWQIYNNTSGAFALTFKVTGQTGFVIPQGRRMVVHCDGTDIRASSAAIDPSSRSEFDQNTAAIFQQTTAPTLWTKSATHNDKALRVVSGTAGSGGSQGFTATVFGGGKSTSGFTLTQTEMPVHGHPYTSPLGAGGGYSLSGASTIWSAQTTGNAGSGGSHAHSLSLDLYYVDVIIATKQ